jgi:hypothetical protein
VFLAEVLKRLWKLGPVRAEVLKPQVDDAGYDVAIHVRSILRHIQIKSSSTESKTANQKIHISLRRKPSGCVVWIRFAPDSMNMESFLWYGGNPGRRLPGIGRFKIAKHTKGDSTGHKAERRNLRVVPKGKFTRLETINEVVERLFGSGPRIGRMPQPKLLSALRSS